MKFTFKKEIIPLLLVIISVVLGFYFYAHFPAQVPLHWNVYGQADSWGSRFAGAIMGPATVAGIYLLFLLIPLIDPKKEKYEQFGKTFRLFRLLLMLVMLGVYLIASLSGLGYNVKVQIWIPVLIGLLFIFMGNYMGKIKPNWFMGIRTPWTLSNDEVWTKTHRLGGKMFMLLGLFMLCAPLLPSMIIFTGMITLVVLLVLSTTVYSYLLFKKIKK
ncbi:MAG: SdpI family protein [Candidatus Komeilibacteria bacterium]|nr:SdpI family protein [Candidatus Komeilibacteria bacterium]